MEVIYFFKGWVGKGASIQNPQYSKDPRPSSVKKADQSAPSLKNIDPSCLTWLSWIQIPLVKKKKTEKDI